MADRNLSTSVASDLTNVQTDFSVDPISLDRATDSKETKYVNSKWSQQVAYHKTIPELNGALNAKSTWTIGKGFTADEVTTILLNKIRGWGKDTFNTILENAVRTYHIGGDSFCEIIRNKQGILINLKPLDPSVMQIVANKKGRIIRYERLDRHKKRAIQKFKPDEIFHLSKDRIADEIHGVSVVDVVEWIILARNEAMADQRILMHRYVKPIRLWKVDSNDDQEIAAFKTTVDEATEKAENIYMPKDVAEHEIASVAPNATLNPLEWIDRLNTYFYEAVAVPRIIVGGAGGFTESAVKIAHVSFMQNIEKEQLFVEEQVLAQLKILIKLEVPASLINETVSDKPKVDAPIAETRGVEQGDNPFQPNDTTAEAEGQR